MCILHSALRGAGLSVSALGDWWRPPYLLLWSDLTGPLETIATVLLCAAAGAHAIESGMLLSFGSSAELETIKVNLAVRLETSSPQDLTATPSLVTSAMPQAAVPLHCTPTSHRGCMDVTLGEHWLTEAAWRCLLLLAKLKMSKHGKLANVWALG